LLPARKQYVLYECILGESLLEACCVCNAEPESSGTQVSIMCGHAKLAGDVMQSMLGSLGCKHVESVSNFPEEASVGMEAFDAVAEASTTAQTMQAQAADSTNVIKSLVGCMSLASARGQNCVLGLMNGLAQAALDMYGRVAL
jgi:Ciliary BBSome complex subunit 2, C-terminal